MQKDYHLPVSRAEFITLMAMMFASIAFSIDAMLSVLPDIARDLDLADPGRSPLILMIFMAGLGLGTFVTGPVSDAFGRRKTLMAGAVIYAIGAAIAMSAQSFEVMLVARFIQGFGAAGPRVVSLAVVRDVFAGREMARVMSFVILVFLVFPALAPAFGNAIAIAAGWRAIFAAFLIFIVILSVWYLSRIPETLQEEHRRPLRIGLMWDAVKEMFAHPTVRLSIAVQTLMLAILFTLLTMIQPIFEVSFDRADSFPYWFGAIALGSGISSFINASLVLRFGMRRLITWALYAQILISFVCLAAIWPLGPDMFWVFVVWQLTVMFQAGMTVANLNAIAMEPMGHIAGMAASVIGAVSTIVAAGLAAPMGFLFDGTPRPLMIIVLGYALLAAILMQFMRFSDRKTS
ncbi:MAG: multidrug effflux MFS transporter [Rhodobacteraceae bacterium]|nr:multidrug effflux MFS transporter [Paracoccaceae bacterium]